VAGFFPVLVFPLLFGADLDFPAFLVLREASFSWESSLNSVFGVGVCVALILMKALGSGVSRGVGLGVVFLRRQIFLPALLRGRGGFLCVLRCVIVRWSTFSFAAFAFGLASAIFFFRRRLCFPLRLLFANFA